MRAIPAKPEAMNNSIFRSEVSEIDRKRWLGVILLAQPVSALFYAFFSFAIALSIALALYFVEYTRKERVTGFVALDKGSAKVYPLSSGVVVKKQFSEGDLVSAGQVLYVISTERTTKMGDTQIEIARRIASRRSSLVAEKQKQLKISAEEELALKRRATDIRAELTSLANDLTTAIRRIEISTSAVVRARELIKQNFVSQAGLDQKEQELLEAQSRQQMLERNSLALQKELNTILSDLQQAPNRATNRASEFDRQIASVEQEAAEIESRRELQVLAPQAGKVTASQGELGQVVTPTNPIVSILPVDSKFEAVLYLPSRAIGFVENGQTVQLRYAAYPFQKFGQYEGRITEISRTALSVEELKVINPEQREGLYRLKVTPTAQQVMAYGKPAELQDGMQLEADILIDKRKLYEWVLEPLLSLTGKI
jgi:membrane fusion protein